VWKEAGTGTTVRDNERGQMSLLWIILIVILVLALLGFVGGRGRW
jgi:flagellar basal body-associated protein FliL